MIVGWFAEVCRRRGLKINAGNSKVMVLNGEEGLESEVHIDGISSENVSEFKYLECVLDDSGKDGAECRRKLAGAIRSLVLKKSLSSFYVNCFLSLLSCQ